MYYITTIILSFACFNFALCATDCDPEHLGAEVPESACDPKFCQSVTIEQINAIKNNPVLATKWNKARAVLVSTCNVTYNFATTKKADTSLDVKLHIDINYKENCAELTGYDMTFASKSDAAETYKIFATIDGGHEWDMCFVYLKGSNFIYRRCRTLPPPPAGKGYATIYVYEEAGKPSGQADIIAAADKLNVTWANEKVPCL